MTKIKLEYTHDRQVAAITLDDSKGNVLDYLMMEELQAALNSFKDEKGLKIITFEGAGKHFSFGASVEEHQKEYAATMLRSFHQLFYSLRDLSVPTLAKISGQCLGGGLEVAMMCNFLFADKSARLGQPEILLGVFPPPASIILSEKIGLARAEELLITGRTITGEEAKNIGLVNEIFEDKAAMQGGAAQWMEQHILPKSASSLRYGVKAARAKFNHVLGNFLPQLENLYVHRLMETADANEGISSFIEKRKPVWKNE
ncbi:MAG: enoyl-CoA hydratase/isomerase family protein [Saprospiraceae bacterium]|nr:enoyl-CoA hydratase/isomerase family protein [Saprospiraceae bacterium]MCF8249006.1 enoyl-CoA hydratase/isomerase family protein [Saprospiraceae bacterium]MCF8283251.1 enoyl-CoA hydratase/isomerase family protein [Bacteroidales bacterium]MCF8310900.1 enoyl-CoA hydratase/isomerase family protein [Saprospiraceae bacterium]MCF8439512.1 enoyl-CoA hydratase/isomerase family protein [Saprospiraceae bacterium]